MVDTPKRVFGPRQVYSGDGTVAYTVPTVPSTTTVVRDMTFANTSASTLKARVAIGDITIPKNRYIDLNVGANTTESYRGALIMNGGETLELQQASFADTPSIDSVATNNTGGAANNLILGAWTPAADTLYLLVDQHSKADAPDVISSITGNGTWTSIASNTTGSVAAQNDMRLSTYYWYSSVAGANATTTINYSGAVQVETSAAIYKMTNVLKSITNTPYTELVRSAGTAQDTVAPSATNADLPITLSGEKGGFIVLIHGKEALETHTATTGFTNFGNQAAATIAYFIDYSTGTDAYTTSPTPASIWAGTNTTIRIAQAVDFAPDVSASGLTFTVNAVEVT